MAETAGVLCTAYGDQRLMGWNFVFKKKAFLWKGNVVFSVKI
jgi:hypothetical protein